MRESVWILLIFTVNMVSSQDGNTQTTTSASFGKACCCDLSVTQFAERVCQNAILKAANRTELNMFGKECTQELDIDTRKGLDQKRNAARNSRREGGQGKRGPGNRDTNKEGDRPRPKREDDPPKETGPSQSRNRTIDAVTYIDRLPITDAERTSLKECLLMKTLRDVIRGNGNDTVPEETSSNFLRAAFRDNPEVVEAAATCSLTASADNDVVKLYSDCVVQECRKTIK